MWRSIHIAWCTSCGKWVNRCQCKVTITCVDLAPIETPKPVAIHIKPRPPASLTFGKQVA